MKEQLEKYVQDVKDRHEQCRGDEALTKSSLIVPLFTILGYDVADPRQCKPEYKASFGKDNKARKAVDWAFFVNDLLAFLVEAKAVGQKIRAHDEQLRIYYSEGQGVKLGILTTGVQWRFFTDLDKKNCMDNEPFLEWDVLGGNGAIPFKFLTILQRTGFNPENIESFAKKKHRQNLLVEELTQLLEPSPEFVRLAIKKFEDRSVTAKVIGEWKPILAGALREWAQQQRLTAALEDQPPPRDPSNPVGKPKGLDGGQVAGVDDRTEEPASVSLKDIIEAGLLKPPLKLTKHYKGKDLEADLLPDGTIRFCDQICKSCSDAAEVAANTVTGKKLSIDGWQFWRYVDEHGNLVPLDTARHGFLSHPATAGDQKSV